MKDVFSRRKQNTIIILSNIFLLFDCIVTIIAIDLYQTRVIHDNNLDVKHKDYYEQHYQNIYSDEKVKNKIETTWGNEVMIKTFPNLKITNSSGDIIYLNSFYPDIQNYYIKLFDNETMNLVNGE